MLAPGAEPPILVRGLSKVFRVVHECEEGLALTLRSLFARRFTAIEAVRDVSFEIAEGETSASWGRTARARRQR